MPDVPRPPVTDWATDFDHTHPDYAASAPEIWDELRETCPVAHTDRFGGAWLPTRHEDVAAIAKDTEHFTSQGIIVTDWRPEAPRPMGYAPPITSDPPFHAIARKSPAGVLLAQGDRRLGNDRPRDLPRTHRRDQGVRRRRRRCGHRIRPAHPRQGDRRHARAASRGRRQVPRLHPPHPRGAGSEHRHQLGRHARLLPRHEGHRSVAPISATT